MVWVPLASSAARACLLPTTSIPSSRMAFVNRRFRVNTPAVASEIIDGEAVIMNLKSGAYFSTRQVGSVVWAWIEQGIPETAMVRSLQGTFAGSAEIVEGAVEQFLSQLIEHGLVREVPLGPMPPPEPAPGDPSVESFTPPVLEVYTDMQDLLLLDPIHDVDEDQGWPSPKPPGEAVA